MSVTVDRRTFLKIMSAAGVTTALVSAPATVVAAPALRAATAPGAAAGPLTTAEELLATVPKEKLLLTYARMMLSRTWEETIMRVRLAGEEMYGNWYPYIGEEAISAGIVLALDENDMISMTHRAIGQYLAKGGDLNGLSAELFGRTTGVAHGYSGPLHVIDRAKGILGANGIVGGGWYTAYGSAFAAMANKTGQVSVTFAGDGATNSAYFFSAVRTAADYRVPAIFVIENNLYQSSTYYRNCSPCENLIDYVKGLPVMTALVDGNDVASVYQVAKQAVDRARAGEGPAVIEAKTYRWYDHSNFAGVKEDKPGAWGLTYRTDFELQQWMARDPIPRFHEFLTAHSIATAEELAAIDEEQLALVDEAIEFGRTSPLASPEMGCENVCANVVMTRTQFFNRQGLAA